MEKFYKKRRFSNIMKLLFILICVVLLIAFPPAGIALIVISLICAALNSR